MFVRWFFVIGGTAFLLVGLYLRERPGEAADVVALTFGLIGFFWLAPQLAIMAVQRWRGQ